MRRATMLAVATLIHATSLDAQRAGVTALPDSAVARVDRIFATLGTGEVPGCAIGMSRDGQPVLTRAYGLANLEHGVPNTPETVFESGSVAKQFTAAAVVLLARDGRLSLDDDIRTHLPEVPDFGRRITVRHLLTHTSGLRDQWGLLSLMGSGPGSQVHDFNTILGLVSRQKALNFDPGAEYLYSNTGYTLAAIIVQRVSGQPFAAFSEERLFKPLGMRDTRWRADHTAIVKQRATAYSGTAATGFRQDMPFTNVIGNGGLLTTVGDLLRWNAFLDAPPVVFGGRALTDTMETPTTFTSGRRGSYALGLTVGERDGIREVTHGGSTAGYRTWLARYPSRGLSVAVLCNSARANPALLGEQAMSVLLPRPPSSVGPAIATSEADLSSYAGMYRAPRTEAVLQTVVKDGRLTTMMPVASAAVPVSDGRFRVGGQELVFVRDAGRVREALMIAAGDTTRYLPVAAASPIAASLAAYAGSYWSDELETRFRIVSRDGRLVVQQRLGEEVTLTPTFADGFTSPAGTVVFGRNRAGRVTGFGIWAGRVRNVRFTREQAPRGRLPTAIYR